MNVEPLLVDMLGNVPLKDEDIKWIKQELASFPYEPDFLDEIIYWDDPQIVVSQILESTLRLPCMAFMDVMDVQYYKDKKKWHINISFPVDECPYYEPFKDIIENEIRRQLEMKFPSLVFDHITIDNAE